MLTDINQQATELGRAILLALDASATYWPGRARIIIHHGSKGVTIQCGSQYQAVPDSKPLAETISRLVGP